MEGGHMDGDATFEDLDARLNIYALANGMDLVRTASSWRLEWYSGGLERGILLSRESDGTLTITSQVWNHGDEAPLRSVEQRRGLDPGEGSQELPAILEESLHAANAL